MSGYVYMLASRRNGTLYLGVTSDLVNRVHAHREGKGSAFAKKYDVKMLVWWEWHDRIESAIQRETSLKRWPRQWKIDLIVKMNPNWDDLYPGMIG